MMMNIVICILVIAEIVTGEEFSNTHDAKIDQLLKKLNKPALKSIKSPDGDIIDCVHMKNHPIYDHPLFKNHTIQLRPSSYPNGWNGESSTTKKQSIVTQLWTINGKCSKNSIPIRRTKIEDILQAKSIKGYGKKDPNFSRSKPVDSINDHNIHEYAEIKVHGNFHGAHGTINVWKPYVQTPKEFSLAQMWLVTCGGPYHEINTIEFGWQVYQRRYGDDNARYFVYWTADGYHKSGCYNLDCPGFVPVNQGFALGAVISNVSTMDGPQSHIPTTIWKDPHSGNWWLKLNYHLIVGYWPSKLMVHNTQQQKMGSGRFASEGYGKASYFRNLEIFDEFDIRKPVQGGYTAMTKASCYNIIPGYEGIWGNYFFYGGPGRNQNCT
ncbi:hypothetical protein EUTSA_v10012162mg [Eutrema salsugineum]|uniref:Neprosin PEP catalytic domain-containing protein n=1 Tax=Eutrema salsugineum TaxID=72664 RepID=V4KU47_EUTSA|nr:hypothetical protein EUTSA_v10012162mg [Eutrema salsugineum]